MTTLRLQEGSNFKSFSVLLTDSTDGGTAVPAPSAAVFYLYSIAEDDTATVVVNGSSATPATVGDNQLISYRASTSDMTDVTRIAWQFKVTWTTPDRVQWTPVEYAIVGENLA